VLQVTGVDEILSISPDLQAALTSAAAKTREPGSSSGGSPPGHHETSA
jgi:hypothetical protein